MGSSERDGAGRRLFAKVPLWWLEGTTGTLTFRLYLAIVCEAGMKPGPVSITNGLLRKHGLNFTNRPNARRAIRQLHKMGLIKAPIFSGYEAVKVRLPHRAQASVSKTNKTLDEEVII